MSLVLRRLPVSRGRHLALVLPSSRAVPSLGLPSRLNLPFTGRPSLSHPVASCWNGAPCKRDECFGCGPSSRRVCVRGLATSAAAGAVAEADIADRLPVMLLSGFLGAGKTTTLKHILTNQEGLRVAIVVNDVADMNIDQKMLKNVDIEDAAMVELSNGCMCCSLREDLVASVVNIAKKKAYDLLIIEGTGVALPLPVAATFATDLDLIENAYLDTVTTVVDAPRFVTDVMEAKDLEEVGMTEHEGDDRVVSDILVEQVETADLLLINKTDCVTEDQLGELSELLKELNPKAKQILMQNGKAPLEEVVLTNRFDFHVVTDAAGWVDKLNKAAEAGHNHDHDHDDHSVHGISSFVFTAKRPFHPNRLAEELESAWPGLLRSKGFFWLATRNDIRGMWHTAGQAWSGEYFGYWDAAMSPEEHGLSDQDILEANWDPQWGDRMQELVFIGIGMDKDDIRGRLQRCLLTDEEMDLGPDGWLQMEDPLPEWYGDAYEEAAVDPQEE